MKSYVDIQNDKYERDSIYTSIAYNERKYTEDDSDNNVLADNDDYDDNFGDYDDDWKEISVQWHVY